MLLFNFSGDGRAGIFTDISKHPMLLFNLFAGFKKKKPKKFQNILCYCLTAACARRAAGRAISKHPMLLFNTNDCVVERHEF